MIQAPASTEISGAATNGRVEARGMRSAVNLVTSNAAITATDVEGPVHLRTFNGDIAVANTTGSLVLDTINGRIEVIGAGATRVDASTTNRPITITLTTSPRRVVAATRNADIDIEVPADSPAYAVELTAGNGTTRVDGIVDDPDASQGIRATTQNGDISIRRSTSRR